MDDDDISFETLRAPTSFTATFTSTSGPDFSLMHERHDNCIRADMQEVSSDFGNPFDESQLYSVLHSMGLINIGDKFEACVAGGAIVRHLMKTDVLRGDIDVFPESNKGLNLLKKHFEKDHELTPTKYSLTFIHKMGMKKIKVQLITQELMPPTYRLGKFDMEHCKVAYTGRTKNKREDFMSLGMALPMLAARKIKLAHVKNMPYTMKRVMKYKAIGFDADEALNLLVDNIALACMSKEDIERIEAGCYS
jgi:hypothetical protein